MLFRTNAFLSVKSHAHGDLSTMSYAQQTNAQAYISHDMYKFIMNELYDSPSVNVANNFRLCFTAVLYNS